MGKLTNNKFKSTVVFCGYEWKQNKTSFDTSLKKSFRKKKIQSGTICSKLVKIMYFQIVFNKHNFFLPTLTKYFNFVFTLNFCPDHACFRTVILFTLSFSKKNYWRFNLFHYKNSLIWLLVWSETTAKPLSSSWSRSVPPFGKIGKQSVCAIPS